MCIRDRTNVEPKNSVVVIEVGLLLKTLVYQINKINRVGGTVLSNYCYTIEVSILIKNSVHETSACKGKVFLTS